MEQLRIQKQIFLVLNYFRKDRNRRGGGVMVYVPCDQSKAVRRYDLEDDAVEALWIETRTKDTTMLVCNVYRPPDDKVAWMDDFADDGESSRREDG